MPDAAYWQALMLEKANHIKRTIAEFNRLAGSDDAKFRKAVLEYFKPDKLFDVSNIEKQGGN